MAPTRNRLLYMLMPCILACLTPAAAVATTVYKTVDENGVVTFSDSAPADNQPAERLDIEVVEPQLDETEQQRLEAMRETTDRMAADRMAREKHRAEMRKLRTEQQVAETGYPPGQPQAYYQPTTTIISSRSHWRHGGRFGVGYRDDNFGFYWGNRPPRPEHPIARPPLRPGHGKLRPGHGNNLNPPLRRPVYNEYPASLVRKGYDPRVRTVIETGYYPSRR